MVAKKLTKENREHIVKIIDEGHQIKDCAKIINKSRIYNIIVGVWFGKERLDS